MKCMQRDMRREKYAFSSEPTIPALAIVSLIGVTGLRSLQILAYYLLIAQYTRPATQKDKLADP